jgi:hypothetical protein
MCTNSLQGQHLCRLVTGHLCLVVPLLHNLTTNWRDTTSAFIPVSLQSPHMPAHGADATFTGC